MVSLGYVESLIEKSLSMFNAQDIDFLFPTDKTDSLKLANDISRMTDIPVLSDYNNASSKTMVIEFFLNYNHVLEYPGVKFFSLFTRHGYKNKLTALEVDVDEISCRWE